MLQKMNVNILPLINHYFKPQLIDLVTDAFIQREPIFKFLINKSSKKIIKNFFEEDLEKGIKEGFINKKIKF